MTLCQVFKSFTSVFYQRTHFITLTAKLFKLINGNIRENVPNFNISEKDVSFLATN